jgi:hypothetical protein
MIVTDTITVKITENDEDSGLGLKLYVSNLVGVSRESLSKTSSDIKKKNHQTYFEDGASFKEIKGIRSSSVRQYGVVVKCQSHERRATDNRPG